MGPRTIWITRAEPGASATAARVRALGLTPVIQPLLAVRRIAGAAIDLAGAAAIAVTSANAVEALEALTPERDLPLFAVGDATARAAARAGFGQVVSAGGDVQALADAIAARKADLRGFVFYPSAAAPARDLTEMLAASGVTVRAIPVYETVEQAPPAAFLRRLGELDGVVIHSPRAARVLAAVVAGQPAPRLAVYCLSEQVAAPLRAAGLANVTVAAAPNEAALLALVAPG